MKILSLLTTMCAGAMLLSSCGNGNGSGNDASPKYFPEDPDPIAPTEKIVLFNGDNYDGWDLWVRPDSFALPAEQLFTVADNAMHITGQGYGGCTTKQAYKDYHLTMEFRFVGEAFADRVGKTADGGLLFHCIGPDGSFGGIWRLSFECNLIQGRCCDLIVVGNPQEYPDMLHAKAYVDSTGRWEPDTTKAHILNLNASGRVNNIMYDGKWEDVDSQSVAFPEKPYGEWNTVELICEGNSAEYILNGTTVLKLFDLDPAAGRIQLQSECHAIEYRNITIEPIKK